MISSGRGLTATADGTVGRATFAANNSVHHKCIQWFLCLIVKEIIKLPGVPLTETRVMLDDPEAALLWPIIETVLAFVVVVRRGDFWTALVRIRFVVFLTAPRVPEGLLMTVDVAAVLTV